MRFASSLVESLDEQNGSFRWWHGHTDDRRLVLIADYLIQSATGAADALKDAALAAADHREALFADNKWFVDRGTAVLRHNPAADNEEFLRAFQRGQHEEKRERRLQAGATHTLVHLVQVLDRLAAVLVIVSGVDSDALKAGWPAALRLASDEDRKGKVFSAPGEEGRAAQRALLSTAQDWEDYGPPDWLPWLLQTRNSSAHRAATTSWNLTAADRRGSAIGLLRPFLRQPSMSDMQSMSVGPRTANKDHPLADLLVLEDSADVLDGLVNSMNGFVLHVMAAVEALWQRRIDQPALVIQPGSQWKLEGLPTYEFRGFGAEVNIQKGGPVHVGGQLAKRLLASKVMDESRREFWG